jgi:hypothetical protein
VKNGGIGQIDVKVQEARGADGIGALIHHHDQEGWTSDRMLRVHERIQFKGKGCKIVDGRDVKTTTATGDAILKLHITQSHPHHHSTFQ